MNRLCAIILAAPIAATVAACGTETSTGSDGGGGDSGDGGGTATWVEVVTLKGSISKTSAPFTLEDGEQRMEYDVKGGDLVTAAFYVEPKGTDLMESGGAPVVRPDKAGKGSALFIRDAGDYEIIAESADCTWTVTVYEKR